MKKGISLIVLVITIIVIIILAGSVILSLSANNPIAQATTAKKASDKDSVSSAVTMAFSKIMALNSSSITSFTGHTLTLTAGASTPTGVFSPAAPTFVCGGTTYTIQISSGALQFVGVGTDATTTTVINLPNYSTVLTFDANGTLTSLT